jgi:cytoskeletal protein RodZ
MRTVGEILQETRTKKGLTLEDVERETRIRKKNLLALEKSDWNSLPTTFIKGLLKNYSDFLGLEEKKILAFFRREYDEKKASAPKPLSDIKRRFFLTPAIVSFLLVGIVVAGISTYLFVQYRSFTAPPKLEIQEPQDNIKITSTEVNVIGQTWGDAELKINGEPVQVSPGGAFSVAVGLKEGVNIVVISAANKFGKVSTVRKTVVVENPEPKQNVLSSESKTLKLELRITGKSTFVTVEVDSKRVFNGLMVAGGKMNFEAEEKIKVRTKSAGHTKVVIDGQELIFGKEGEEAEKEFTL